MNIIPKRSHHYTFLLCYWLIDILARLKMVQSGSSFQNDSCGLLPTPNLPPKDGLPVKSYLGSSFYPLPLQAVSLLEGCPIDEVISWDISVSTKCVKIKVVWSCQAKSSDSYSLKEKLPPNLLKAISYYDLARPSWSSSSSSNKLTFVINWPFLSSTPSISPVTSPTKSKTTASINHVLKTPNSNASYHNFDSGYQSNNINSGCYGSSSYNWRQNVSLVINPVFSPKERPKPKNDVYIPQSKASTTPKVVSSSDSPGNSCSSTTSLNIPFAPSQPVIVSSKITSPILNSSKKSETKSAEAIPAVSKLLSSSNDDVPSNLTNNSDSPSISSEISSSQTLANSSKVKGSQPSISEPSNVNVSDFPVPPAGFPNKFYPSPNPLPINEDGFLDPSTKAYYMDIIGKCRLCNSSVSSHLIDLHLLECPKIDHKPIDKFVRDVANHTPLKIKDIMISAKKYSKFELQESKIPNKIFKKKKHYELFTRYLEDLNKLLTKNAFESLKLSESLENFNLIKYTL